MVVQEAVLHFIKSDSRFTAELGRLFKLLEGFVLSGRTFSLHVKRFSCILETKVK